MQALTIHMTARADGQPGADVVLRRGAPQDGGEPLTDTEHLPPLADDLATDLKALRQAMLAQTGRLPKLPERARAIGALLLPGAVRTKWQALQIEARAQLAEWIRDRDAILKDPEETETRKAWARERPGYRTYVQIEAPDRDWIPWEFARLNDDALFLLADAPYSRYRVMPGTRKGARPGWQIRILVVVAAEKPGDIQADEEVRAIKSALRPLDRIYDVDLIEQPTRKGLTTRLNTFKPHVLHFIGHGAGDHLQIYSRDSQAIQPWGATQIAEDVNATTWIPEVAYLNACRSQGITDPAKATVADQDRQRTIVDALLGRQVLAVVAMQADVRGPDAAACAAAFYGAILDGSPIDIACAKGRVSVNQVPGRDGARDPYLPVLTLTVPADSILKHNTAIADPAAPMVNDRLARFVDRHDDRRKIVRHIEDGRYAIVLRGAQDIGKSSLLCWSMDLCLRRDYHVRYLELGACHDWLHVLRSLRDGGRLARIQDPLGPLLGSSFNWKLSHLANGQVKPGGAPGELEPDNAGTLAQIDASPNKPPNFGLLACAAFHEALTATTKKPLVLVFDQIEAGDRGLSSEQFALLRSQWIDPLIARGDGRVQLLLAIRTERQYDYNLDVLPPSWGSADIRQFPEHESHELLRELFRLKLLAEAAANGVQEPLMLKQMQDELSSWEQGAINGRELHQLLDALWITCVKRVRLQQRQQNGR